MRVQLPLFLLAECEKSNEWLSYIRWWVVTAHVLPLISKRTIRHAMHDNLHRRSTSRSFRSHRANPFVTIEDVNRGVKGLEDIRAGPPWKLWKLSTSLLYSPMVFCCKQKSYHVGPNSIGQSKVLMRYRTAIGRIHQWLEWEGPPHHPRALSLENSTQISRSKSAIWPMTCHVKTGDYASGFILEKIICAAVN